jgi:alpha-L-fucosidase 2
MKTTRREFIHASAALTLAAAQPVRGAAVPTPESKNLDPFQIARRHSIVRDLPSPNFFEGMLLGNGDVGVCVVVRPDALGLHIGKNDCWDIRVSEDGKDDVLPFPDLLKLWQRASEAAKKLGKPDMLFIEDDIDFFREYTAKVQASYERPWPRPWPCGTIWVHWDPRWVEPRKQVLDLANGLFTLNLDCTSLVSPPHTVTLSCFVDWSTGLVSAWSSGPASFLSVNYYPHLDKVHDKSKPDWGVLPRPETNAKAGGAHAEFSCFQYFPSVGPTASLPSPPRTETDRNFSLYGRLAGQWTVASEAIAPGVALAGSGAQNLRLDIQVATPRDLWLKDILDKAAASNDRNPWISLAQNHVYGPGHLDTGSYARQLVTLHAGIEAGRLQQTSEAGWREFWSRSAVELDDQELEGIWYRNQYFLGCCLRKGKVAPGLFANWSAGDIGTEWHGDYHLDYNCQQVFWGVFSSNHVEQHMPYVELCENLMSMSEKFASDNFGLPGACFPLTAYPVPNQTMPFSAPPWAYQVGMTPWTVQSLWWQYLYTQDEDYLRRVYPIVRAAASFVAAYAKRDADGKYHVEPTVSPENWGFTVDFRLNKDCIFDLALIRFLLDAVIEASTVLNTDAEQRAHWGEVRENLAPYPTVKGPYGEVWLDILNAPAESVYNVPITLAPVFPGEQVGVGRVTKQMEIALRTARTVRLEGGNDLVYQPLIRARLGVLDLEWFKREVRYCSLTNGVANDRVRQIGGRYEDATDFDFMMRMGIWTENLALPAVLNECMMQSYAGVIHLFPNTQNLGPARFENLRAAGAFLVSATYNGETVSRLTLLSEKGKTVRIAKPWKVDAMKVTRQRDGERTAVRSEGEVLAFETTPGEIYRIEPIP